MDYKPTPQQTDFGLYIHWPFCLSKCPYCDFNSHVRTSVDWQEWFACLKTEMNFYGNQTWGRRLTSIFFGGGTPSLMPARMIEGLVKTAQKYWKFDDEIEITLEANPSSVESQKFFDYRQSGINRLSIGIQSLNDKDLKFLGRHHDSKQAIQAIEMAAKHFEKYSFDLIYALPHQLLSAWQQELKQAIAFAGSHLSLYQLTVEPGTVFEKNYKDGLWPMPDPELSADFYQWTNQFMRGQGFDHYEISNYAKSNAQCRHNLTYWRYQDYIGIGPGAHGRMKLNQQKYASFQLKVPETWQYHLLKHGHGTKDFYPLSPLEQRMEAVLMGLRLAEGIDLTLTTHEIGINLLETLSSKALQELQTQQLLTVSATKLQATELGRLKLNALIEYLLTT